MRLYVNGRGSGKTMWAMMESARTGVPILALSRKQKQNIVRMALDLRELYNAKRYNQTEIGLIYGVSQKQVSNIVRKISR